MEGAYMKPEDMNYKFTAILILAICIISMCLVGRLDENK